MAFPAGPGLCRKLVNKPGRRGFHLCGAAAVELCPHCGAPVCAEHREKDTALAREIGLDPADAPCCPHVPAGDA